MENEERRGLSEIASRYEAVFGEGSSVGLSDQDMVNSIIAHNNGVEVEEAPEVPAEAAAEETEVPVEPVAEAAEVPAEAAAEEAVVPPLVEEAAVPPVVEEAEELSEEQITRYYDVVYRESPDYNPELSIEEKRAAIAAFEENGFVGTTFVAGEDGEVVEVKPPVEEAAVEDKPKPSKPERQAKPATFTKEAINIYNAYLTYRKHKKPGKDGEMSKWEEYKTMLERAETSGKIKEASRERKRFDYFNKLFELVEESKVFDGVKVSKKDEANLEQADIVRINDTVKDIRKKVEDEMGTNLHFINGGSSPQALSMDLISEGNAYLTALENGVPGAPVVSGLSDTDIGKLRALFGPQVTQILDGLAGNAAAIAAVKALIEQNAATLEEVKKALKPETSRGWEIAKRALLIAGVSIATIAAIAAIIAAAKPANTTNAYNEDMYKAAISYNMTEADQASGMYTVSDMFTLKSADGKVAYKIDFSGKSAKVVALAENQSVSALDTLKNVSRDGSSITLGENTYDISTSAGKRQYTSAVLEMAKTLSNENGSDVLSAVGNAFNLDNLNSGDTFDGIEVNENFRNTVDEINGVIKSYNTNTIVDTSAYDALHNDLVSKYEAKNGEGSAAGKSDTDMLVDLAQSGDVRANELTATLKEAYDAQFAGKEGYKEDATFAEMVEAFKNVKQEQHEDGSIADRDTIKAVYDKYFEGKEGYNADATVAEMIEQLQTIVEESHEEGTFADRETIKVVYDALFEGTEDYNANATVAEMLNSIANVERYNALYNQLIKEYEAINGEGSSKDVSDLDMLAAVIGTGKGNEAYNGLVEELYDQYFKDSENYNADLSVEDKLAQVKQIEVEKHTAEDVQKIADYTTIYNTLKDSYEEIKGEGSAEGVSIIDMLDEVLGNAQGTEYAAVCEAVHNLYNKYFPEGEQHQGPYYELEQLQTYFDSISNTSNSLEHSINICTWLKITPSNNAAENWKRIYAYFGADYEELNPDLGLDQPILGNN